MLVEPVTKHSVMVRAMHYSSSASYLAILNSRLFALPRGSQSDKQLYNITYNYRR